MVTPRKSSLSRLCREQVWTARTEPPLPWQKRPQGGTVECSGLRRGSEVELTVLSQREGG